MALDLAKSRWPRRLLNVFSMESFKRSKDGYYGALHNPPFTAISYTWGRFTVEKGPALDVSGISWQVPRINPNHFTLDRFQSVLKKAAGPNGLVWVDIACIDQEDIDVKMDEIGNQADIFRRASNVYVWLTSLDDESSKCTVQSLDRFASRLEQIELTEYTNEYKSENFLEEILGDAGTLRCSLASFFGDPWFSSLWTLQEACLCEHAILLTGSGHTIPKFSPRLSLEKIDPLLDHLIGNCQTIKIALLPYLEHSEAIRQLLEMIDRSGLSFINPGFNASAGSLLLYSAARYRTTTNPLDRIYGIMQVFGLRLGASREPGKNFTLPELEDQLGEALNTVSPTTAQMHVHQIPPPLGSAWRPSSSSFLPSVYYMARCLDSMSSIARETGKMPLYKGSSCTLSEMRIFWNEATSFGERQYAALGPYWQHYACNIHLDACSDGPQEYAQNAQEVQNERLPPSSCPCKGCLDRPKQQKDGLLRFLNTMPRPEVDYRVLMLGTCTLSRWTPPRTKGGGSSWTVAARLGLLTVKEPRLGNDVWRRVGVLSWEAGYGDLKPVHEALWNPFQCYLV